MLLEMQSAMNNMMNSNPMHGHLHGNQTPPIGSQAPPLGSQAPPCPEMTPEDPSPSPSSCSPVSSPRCSPQEPGPEPEPQVIMDTSLSSASDSGEEEVIGSVTRAHQETFMYNQDRSSPPAQSAPALSFAKPAVSGGDGGGTEGKPEARSLHANHTSIFGSYLPHGTQRSNGGYALLNYCPVGQPSSPPVGHCPAYAHGPSNRAENANETMSDGFSGPVWNRGNRMHLVRITGHMVGVGGLFRFAFMTWPWSSFQQSL